MGHIRLGTLPQSRKWRDVVALLESNAPIAEIAEAAARASELDLKRASDDPAFQFVSRLMVELPLLARAPNFETALEDLGISREALGSVSALMAGLNRAIDRAIFDQGQSSDVGELARAALVESLSVRLREKLPTLFDPTPQEIRKALASFAGGHEFGTLARDFFAGLTYKSLDYYLSRELANHTGDGRRFADDAARVGFERSLRTHTFEASRIVEEFAGGWYGKTVWQKQSLSGPAINEFTRFAFKKLRTELGRRRAIA